MLVSLVTLPYREPAKAEKQVEKQEPNINPEFIINEVVWHFSRTTRVVPRLYIVPSAYSVGDFYMKGKI